MTGKATILVVDDEAAIGDIISAALSKAGYEILYASDAEQAIQTFYREAINLFILDIMMPKMDGFALCEWIRRRSSVPVIMLTARGSVNDIVHGFQVGADDYITKPFTLREPRGARGSDLAPYVLGSGSTTGKGDFDWRPAD